MYYIWKITLIIHFIFYFTLFYKFIIMRSLNKKWFTLVELIIVITILAILATIAFFSFQWEARGARNAKRTADLTTLEKALELARAKTAVNLIQFASWTMSQISSGNVAWTWVYTGATNTDYKAWIPNFTLLGIDWASIKDPSGIDYSFWATTRKDWKYQFAATLEWSKSSWNTALVKGTYTPRWGLTITWTINARSPNLFYITSESDYGKLFVWDIITNVSNTRIVTEISNDLRTITLNGAATAGTITLTSEVVWLIWDYSEQATSAPNWTPVVNWSWYTLPY